MLFTKFNLKPKTQKLISLSLTLTGIIFILASNYIGSIAIRLAMTALLIFCITNIQMTYKYLTKKEIINNIITISASIIGLFKPEFTMFIIGIMLLYFSVPPYINKIKTKDYSDIIMLIIYGIGILFASYCIINSRAALNTIIIIIGIILTIIGCFSMFYILDKKKHDVDIEAQEYNKFEDTSNI
jgi:hypothetical protein